MFLFQSRRDILSENISIAAMICSKQMGANSPEDYFNKCNVINVLRVKWSNLSRNSKKNFSHTHTSHLSEIEHLDWNCGWYAICSITTILLFRPWGLTSPVRMIRISTNRRLWNTPRYLGIDTFICTTKLSTSICFQCLFGSELYSYFLEGISFISNNILIITISLSLPWSQTLTHTEFCLIYSEMMIILFFLQFINSDCTILSGFVSYFKKGITLGCLLLILQV